MVADKKEFSNPRDEETVPLITPLELFGEEVYLVFSSLAYFSTEIIANINKKQLSHCFIVVLAS